MLLFQELNELKEQLPIGHAASEKNDDAPCTLEEIERAQKDLLEFGLQVVKTERNTYKCIRLLDIVIYADGRKKCPCVFTVQTFQQTGGGLVPVFVEEDQCFLTR